MHETTFPRHPAMPPAGLRRAAARALRHAARRLLGWAHRLTAERREPAHEPVLEFYAEAGAPEGALYVDGRRVGVLPGVTRL
ncbi:MAG: hypothetical protein Fur0014_09750 [Rubrivivax sp.]